MSPLSSIIKAAFQEHSLLPATMTQGSAQALLGAGISVHRQTTQRHIQKAMTQRLPPLVSAQNPKDRTLVYLEHNGIRDTKHVLDFNSPRTKEAALQLGLTFEDCVKR